MPVVGRIVVLACVTSHVLLSREPVYAKISPHNLITGVELAHLKHTRALPLYGVIHNAHYCCVIDIDWGGRLWVAKFLQGESKNCPSCMFINSTPNSAFAADAATNGRME